MYKKNISRLHPLHIFGFSGNIMNGLCVHSNMEFIIYPVVTSIIIENVTSKEQTFLESGIPGEITAIALSNSGNYIAASYSPYPGFKATIILWNFHTRQKLSNYETHKDNVHALKFSICDNFIISLGGYGEDNSLICYSINDNEIYCGSNASNSTSGDAYTIQIINDADCLFVTGGENTLRFWKFYHHKKFLQFADISLSKYKRTITCMESNHDNSFLYCGTISGDVLKIKMKAKLDEQLLIENVVLYGCYGKKSSHKKKFNFADTERYVLGVTTIQILKNCHILIGCGDGTIEIVEETELEKIHSSDINPDKLVSPSLPIFLKKKGSKIGSKITSMLFKFDKIFIGTAASEIYFSDETLRFTKFISYYSEEINDVVFPHDYSEVFATASGNNIQLWDSQKCTELLLIHESKSICNSIIFTHKGDGILSLWANGFIKLHTPETGQLICEVEKAHKFEPKIISISLDDSILLTGDISGIINLWKFKKNEILFQTQLKKHKGEITGISFNTTGNFAATIGMEGLCILWNLKECCCKVIIPCLTVPQAVKFHPNEKEIISSGIDRKVRLWSTDGKLLKEIEVSKNSVRCLDLTSDGEFLITGGYDLKIWLCNQNFKLIAVGDSPEIYKTIFSPDQSTILAICNKKRLFLWKWSFQSK